MNKEQWEQLIEQPPEVLRIACPIHKAGETDEFCTNFWSINLYDYSAEVTLNGEKITVNPGDCCIMPPNTRRQFNFLYDSPHRYFHFNFSEVDNSAKATIVDVSKNLDGLIKIFDSAMRLFPLNPARATASIWQLMWEISDCFVLNEKILVHPALQKAVQLIELHLSHSLHVSWLVKQVEISHNQLTRLFQKQFGCTIKAYIRKRRVNEAKRLMKQTSMSLKAIAIEVGLPDLQAFNKTVKKETGLAPRELLNQIK